MEPFRVHTGIVVPLDRANVDTDAIIPKQFLKSIKRSGFGPNLFDEWRYLDHGEPGMDNTKRPLNPDFVLNQSRYRGGSILLARRNFGCGSSREHAPWALGDQGFRAIVAPSYADIFYNNCYKNGLLPVVLGESEVQKLFDATLRVPRLRAHGRPRAAGRVESKDGSLAFAFEVEPFRKHCLVDGLDDIGLTLQHADRIRDFEARRHADQPWLM